MVSTSAKQTVLVTGVSRGIGEAIARRLAHDGYRVVGVSRSQPVDFPGEHRALDLSNPAAAKSGLAEIVREFTPLRLIANAGVAGASGILDVTDDEIDRIMRVNLQAVIWSMQATIPAMKAAGFGRIVVIGSRAALGKTERIAYSASKAALGGLVRTTALETGRNGITVNIVAPGPIETEMFARLQPEGSPARAEIVADTAVGRVGKPEEIAAACGYFLSDEAGFTTGQTLYVCGGMTVGKSR